VSGRGSVVKRGNGYSVVVELERDPVTGKRRQKWHSGYPTKKAAQAALAELTHSVNKGVYVEPTKQTIAKFAVEWLAAIEPTLRPATHYSYGRNLRLHVLPYVGSARLTAIDAGTLNTLYARLLAQGRKDQQAGSGLSPRSVRYVHTIVHKLYKDAVRWGRVVRNPADAADPPKASATPKRRMTTWTAEQLRAFLTATESDRLHALYVLLATTAMRRGEALGLRWADVDLDAGRASIVQTVIAVHHKIQLGDPKTAKGTRVVDLDPATVRAIRAHRTRHAAERLQMGAGWTDHGLVFCHVTGGPLHPERFTRTFVDRVEQLGLPPIRLHDLRHTWATLALESGVHPKVVQERLGHANISITLDTYSHVTAGLQADAAARVAGVIFGAGVGDG
jgi:integrase